MKNAFEIEALLKVVEVREEILESSTEASKSEIVKAGQIEEVNSTGFEIITK